MESLTELYDQEIVPRDAILEKEAAELVKVAEEEDAAGRIMARGFAGELNKLAGGITRRPPVAPSIPKQDKKVTVGGGKTLNPISGNQGTTKMPAETIGKPPAPPPPPPPIAK